MNIGTILSQADWRLRAYLSSDQVDPGRAGWREDPTCCPAAEWLDSEADTPLIYTPSVSQEEVFFGDEHTTTPLLLRYFIDLIDTALMAADAWAAGTDRVTAEEALAALAEAERLAAQRLLPAPRCVYPDCQAAVVTPQLYGFLRGEPNEPIRRQACWPFAGGLCATHIPHLVAPPASWWPAEPAVERGMGLI